MRHALVQDERALEFDLGDRQAMTAEPAFGREIVVVEPLERARDLPVGAQLPVLIITCLTNV
jgi:hypothetical protein